MNNAELIRSNNALDIATLHCPGYALHCLTAGSQAQLPALFNAAAERKAQVVGQFVFAGNGLHEHFMQTMQPPPAWPITWLHGDACRDGRFASAQLIAVSGLVPQPLVHQGAPAGFVYETEAARFCRLGNLRPTNPTASREAQARSVFETAAALLEENGFDFTDTVRTWLYLDQLLDWYGPFNAVRTSFFEKQGVFEKLVPASTGIGAAPPGGAALTMDLLALRPKNKNCTVQAVPSPLQHPALDYQSSFSRAVEIATPDCRELLISGTASITPDGQTAFENDPENQIRLTLDVVEALLRSRQMDWNDLFRGIVYFKNMELRPLYDRQAAERGLPRFPLAAAHADVCRTALLFEIELDAIRIQS